MLYSFYQKYSKTPLIATAVFGLWMGKHSLDCLHNLPSDVQAEEGRRPIRIALICDTMTYDNLHGECSLALVTERNWRQVLHQWQPDLLLCESAWSGPSGCWSRQIYRNHYVLFETRRALFAIVAAFRRAGIPTAFWNKEDPVYFSDRQHDFSDTARHFDYVFTTASECVNAYQNMGCQNVSVLPFGFSPELFNPLGSARQREEAFFAGSWDTALPKRCEAMDELFRLLDQAGIPYTIYDRYFDSPDPARRYPQRYASHVRPGLPYAEMAKESCQYRYAVNINTVTGSETMFARRVYEMMAQNHIIISNRSLGMEKQFPGSIWYSDQPQCPAEAETARRRNLETVFLLHTMEDWLNTLLSGVGLSTGIAAPPLTIFVLSQTAPNTAQLAERIAYPGVRIIPLDNSSPFPAAAVAAAAQEEGYVAFISDIEQAARVPWQFLLRQFSYLPSDCGIRWGHPDYEIVADTNYLDAMFPTTLVASGALSDGLPVNQFLL